MHTNHIHDNPGAIPAMTVKPGLCPLSWGFLQVLIITLLLITTIIIVPEAQLGSFSSCPPPPQSCPNVGNPGRGAIKACDVQCRGSLSMLGQVGGWAVGRWDDR
ncbi:Hypothetical predicted protein [Pelobates cultripes]|uniref:Uncharacterized protein n=1 Tax=Pelobates cultripes TaxID=61616 RepID=A0AAD1SDN4_PELCU|nr:Hypothetical predicted protein [Pelobates cultripes]